MKEYEVKITDYALEQMEKTVEYIACQLQTPETAVKWLGNMKKSLSSLSFSPQRIKRIDEEPWRSEGIRKLIVNRFLVYFFIDDEQAIVWVTGVIYSGREQSAQLEQMEFPSVDGEGKL